MIQHYPELMDDPKHKVDGSFHVARVEIISRPNEGDTYWFGEDIDVALTFSTEAYARPGSVITLRVGDATDGANYRVAGYVSGSGTNRLLYRYRAQFNDFDATGITVDGSGPDSGFGGPLPVAGAEFGSVASPRHFPEVADDASHKVGKSVTASFGTEAMTVSEDGAASVIVQLNPSPERVVAIPIIASPGDGVDAGDDPRSAANLIFAPGETVKRFTVTVIEDGAKSLKLAFGDLPLGVRAGSQAIVSAAGANNDGEATVENAATRTRRKGHLQRNAGHGVQ